jgi:hypothetical protein
VARPAVAETITVADAIDGGHHAGAEHAAE